VGGFKINPVATKFNLDLSITASKKIASTGRGDVYLYNIERCEKVPDLA